MEMECMLQPVGNDEMLAVAGGFSVGDVVAWAVKTFVGGGGSGGGGHNVTTGNIKSGDNSPININNN